VKRQEVQFEFEILTVGGQEGRLLRLEQARAIRELLMWSREHRLRTNNELDRDTPPEQVQD